MSTKSIVNSTAPGSSARPILRLRRSSTQISTSKTPNSSDTCQCLDSLTSRESQVLEGILSDLSNREIAQTLFISIKTVELYRSRMMHKMQAKNATHLVRLVMTCRLSRHEGVE